MIDIQIPGFKHLKLEHLVLDFNGTIAVDGKLIPGVDERLHSLSKDILIHVITADTFGSARSELHSISCSLNIIQSDHQDREKINYLKNIGPQKTVCIGNGHNDCLMLKEAALGIGVILKEGIAHDAYSNADVVCIDCNSALELLIHPLRLVATLRS